MSLRSTLSVLTVLVTATLVLAHPRPGDDSTSSPTNTSTTPVPSQKNPLGYVPNLPVNLIGLLIYVSISLAQTVHHIRKRANYMLAMTIGLWFYTIGIIFRLLLRRDPSSLGIFLIQSLFTILSPCAFIASLYSLVGRMAMRLGTGEYLPVRADKIAKYFVWSDVITFLVQASGGGLEVEKTLAKLGARVFLGGVALQIVSFSLFIIFFFVWLLRVRSRAPRAWMENSWKPLIPAVIVSCIFICVRSIYRLAEGGQGYGGYLSVHEAFFWCLDALPLAIATGIYTIIWPENYLPRDEYGPIVLESLNGSKVVTHSA